MRTDKHKLKSLTPLQEAQFLDVVHAYQNEKNHFSDQLSSHLFNHGVNVKNNCSYFDIRDELAKDNYYSHYPYPIRLWKLALKEAYDLHIRTYEGQIVRLKDRFLSQVYRYFYHHKNDEMSEFKPFFMFAINSAFYDYSSFKKAERQIFNKKFNQAKIYERTAQYLNALLPKSITKKILTKAQTEILSHLFLKEQNNTFFHYFCRLFIDAIKGFRAFKPILSHKNPTIQLDGECYTLYSKYDKIANTNRWFLNIMSLEKRQRIQGLELTGFHHAKSIIKKSANLTLSFDPVTMDVYAHFTFENKKNKNQQEKESVPSLDSELLIGGDFGLTESMTFSDGFVLGRAQGEMLRDISKKTEQSVAQIQKFSLPDFFGMEKQNKENRRNHLNNCFNHNLRLKNINTNYRKRQQRVNKRLEQFKYRMVNEMTKHFMSNTIYGNYQDYLSNTNGCIHFVFESLDYSNLGRNKEQKRQINLIKGMYARLESQIETEQLPFKISYVNSAYTSQMCPHCYYVAKGNRNNGTFRCLHCGYTVLEDEKFQCLRKVIPPELLPPEDDFIASRNIRDRLSSLPDSLKQHRREIEEFLKNKHEEFKGSCKAIRSSA